MNTWLVVSLLVALGIIVGNIMLLKYSAKMKFEKPKDSSQNSQALPQSKDAAEDKKEDSSKN